MFCVALKSTQINEKEKLNVSKNWIFNEYDSFGKF